MGVVGACYEIYIYIYTPAVSRNVYTKNGHLPTERGTACCIGVSNERGWMLIFSRSLISYISSFDRNAACFPSLLLAVTAVLVICCGATREGMAMCARLLGESPSCASPFAAVGHDSGHLCVYDLRATSAEPLLESRLHKAPCKRC